MNKKLYRSRVDSKIAGVCGGLGDYFDIDPTIIRIIAIISIFIHGIGLLAYIVAWIAMPQYPLGQEVTVEKKPRKKSAWNSSLTGIVLVGIGVVFLFDQFFWWFHFHNYFWPIVLILIGAALVIRGINRQEKTENPVNDEINNAGETNHA
ncbi:MAG: PspC domain-containing protein [Candidatus Zixiibacteriota bacterium]